LPPAKPARDPAGVYNEKGPPFGGPNKSVTPAGLARFAYDPEREGPTSLMMSPKAASLVL